MGQIQSLAELLSLLRRRIGLILPIFLIGAVLSAVYAKTRPDTYESTAVIQIEVSRLAPAATGGMPQAPGAEIAPVLQAIEQRLTTREALVEMVDRHGLFPGVDLDDDRKAALMRQSIRFQPIAGAPASYGQPQGIQALAITTGLEDPDQAARVSNDLAQSILDLWSQDQEAQTTRALEFFRQDEARLWSEISRLDAEIAAFKNLNASTLPSQETLLRQELLALETEGRTLDRSRVAAQAELDRIAATGGARTTEQRQSEALTDQLAQLDSQQAALDSRRATIQSDLSRIPEVEKALAAFDRRRVQLESQHTAVTARLADAETASRLAETRQADRMRLLERALSPPWPVGSSGRKLFAAGVLASLALAIGLAFLMDLLRPVIRTAAQMERQTGLRPLIVLPQVATGARAERRARKLRDALAATLGETPRSALILVGAALAAGVLSSMV